MIKNLLFFLRLIKRFGVSNAWRLYNSGKVKSGELTIEFKAAKYPVSLRYNTSDIDVFYQVYYHNYYSFNYDYYLKEIKTIVDGGANIGLASTYFKGLFPNATIIAVEPETSNYQQLLKNTKSYSGIHCEQAGIWNKTAFLKVEDKFNSGNWGFVVEEVIDEKESNVKGISIDDIIKKYNLQDIDILKLDIEGAELELFQENYQWLSKVKMLIIETHDFMRKGTSKAVFKAIIDFNFSVHLCRENIVFINDAYTK